MARQQEKDRLKKDNQSMQKKDSNPDNRERDKVKRDDPRRDREVRK